MITVQHVIRVGGASPCTVFVVDEDWARMDRHERIQILSALYSRAQILEGATSVIVRDVAGSDLARMEDDTPVLLL